MMQYFRSDRNEPMDTFDDNEILDGRSINNNQDLQSDEEDNDDDDLEIDHESNRLEFESVFNKIDKFLDNTKNNRKNSQDGGFTQIMILWPRIKQFCVNLSSDFLLVFKAQIHLKIRAFEMLFEFMSTWVVF